MNVSDPKLQLDMDSSRRDLYKALSDKGFDVTRTTNKDVPEDASDEYQLLWATSHRRILFTFNIKDFVNLAKKHPFHSGIILANQSSMHVSQLISALSKIMTETSNENWEGQVRWIQDWQKENGK
jgi:hypothetical protein